MNPSEPVPARRSTVSERRSTVSERRSTVADKIVVALDRIARGQRAHRQGVATDHRLSPLQAELLTTVQDGPPPDPLVSRLARELAVAQPTVTESVRSLERKGLLDRRNDPDDRRRTLVELTADGAALVGRLHDEDRRLVDALERLDPERQEEVLDVLLDLIAAFVGGGVIDVARTCTTCEFHHVGPDGTRRCALLDADLPTAALRVDCPDHVSAAALADPVRR